MCDAIATKYNKILYHRKLIDFPKWYLGLLAAMNEKYNFIFSCTSYDIEKIGRLLRKLLLIDDTMKQTRAFHS